MFDIVALFALTLWVARVRGHESRPLGTIESEASEQIARAIREADDARKQRDATLRSLAEVQVAIATSVLAVEHAATDDERQRAEAQLKALLRQEVALREQLEVWGRDTERKCVCVSRACLENPLAPGCF